MFFPHFLLVKRTFHHFNKNVHIAICQNVVGNLIATYISICVAKRKNVEGKRKRKERWPSIWIHQIGSNIPKSSGFLDLKRKTKIRRKQKKVQPATWWPAGRAARLAAGQPAAGLPARRWLTSGEPIKQHAATGQPLAGRHMGKVGAAHMGKVTHRWT